MVQRDNGNRINQHLQTIASSVTSGKGVAIQLLSWQLALPAIANETDAIALPLPLPDEASHQTSDFSPITLTASLAEISLVETPDTEDAQVIYEQPIYEEAIVEPTIYAPIPEQTPKHSFDESVVYYPLNYVPEQSDSQLDQVVENTVEGENTLEEDTFAEENSFEAEVAAVEPNLETYSDSASALPVAGLVAENNSLTHAENFTLPLGALVEQSDAGATPRESEIPLALTQRIGTNPSKFRLAEKVDSDSSLEGESWLEETIFNEQISNPALPEQAELISVIPSTAANTTVRPTRGVVNQGSSYDLLQAIEFDDKAQQTTDVEREIDSWIEETRLLSNSAYAVHSAEVFVPSLIPQSAVELERADYASEVPLALVQPSSFQARLVEQSIDQIDSVQADPFEDDSVWRSHYHYPTPQPSDPESWLAATFQTSDLEGSSHNVPSLLPSQGLLLAGPESLNPGLLSPESGSESVPSIPSVVPSVSSPQPIQDLPEESNSNSVNNERITDAVTETTDSQASDRFITWNGLSVGFDSNFDTFDQGSWQILPTVEGTLSNGDRISLSSGYSQFSQSEVDSVTHVPLTVGWRGQRGNLTLEASAGLNFFNTLPVDTHFKSKVSAPLSSRANISATVEQGPLLFNAEAINNQISSWQYGPEFYWQISPNTSLFSSLRFGSYSDGNQAVQSYSRLERTIAEVATASINLTTASFDQDVVDTSGYFSPPDFLIASAELSWQEPITDGLVCGLMGSVGQQRLEGEWAVAYTSQATCSVEFSPNLQADLGYRISNTSNGQSLFSDNAYSNQSIFGGIRIQF